MSMINGSVYQRTECQYNAADDNSFKAYKSGWAHGYFGLDAGYNVEAELDMYESGKRDGRQERERVVALGFPDPYDW